MRNLQVITALSSLAAIVACGKESNRQLSEPGRCTPGNQGISGRTTHGGTATMGGQTLLGLLRDDARTPHPDVDEAMRALLRTMCQPCVLDANDAPISDLFPLEVLDKAMTARCMELVLPDGNSVKGKLYPRLHAAPRGSNGLAE